jgi:hypothetical protein
MRRAIGAGIDNIWSQSPFDRAQLFRGIDAMTLYEKLYLGLTIGAFLIFMVSLAGVVIVEGRQHRS